MSVSSFCSWRKFWVGLEVRVGLGNCEQGEPQAPWPRMPSAAADGLRGPEALTALVRAWVTESNVLALVRGVTLDRLDEVRDQVVTTLELRVDVGERLAAAAA